MELILNTLKIDYFKGIKHMEISPNGKNLAITGKNKLGKTTIYDAFLWLLFGKNSAGEQKFTLKPTNEPVETENSVEGEFTVDDKILILKKVYVSKFVKATGEYKSSEIECYINGAPKKIREYETAISEIIGEEQFKLLTNPKHFTEVLEWKKRREILFSISESKSDKEIADESLVFSEIVSDIELYGNTTDFLKAIGAQVKANSERINIIPKLINENSMKITEQSKTNSVICTEIAELEEKIRISNEKIGEYKSWKPENSKRAELISKINQLSSEKQRLNNNMQIQNNNIMSQHNEKVRNNGIMLEETKFEHKKVLNRIRELTENRQTLLDEYKKIKDMAFNDTVCPTCGQAYPFEHIKEAEEKFNEHKKKLLDNNMSNGKASRSELEMYTASEVTLRGKIADYEKQAEELQNNPPAMKSADTTDIDNEIASRKKELENYPETTTNPHSDEIISLTEEIKDYRGTLSELNNELVRLDENTAITNRIEQLRSEQTQLRTSQTGLQKKFDLATEFVKFKTERITESINGMFKIAKFKLFEPNKTNDGLMECCDPIAFGANRYNDINTAGKILVGIDIISTLSAHYGLSVPLFIDNIDGLDSASYDTLIKSISGNMQLITLRVSDNDTLTTEVF
jgi:hypothetical protein